MAIPAREREKMLAVRLCGPRVIARLESIGITQLRDLAERDPDQLIHEINIAAGRPIWHPPDRPPRPSLTSSPPPNDSETH
jgi:nucleotidyltransferase/DNA polymerase involved in DNA repair